MLLYVQVKQTTQDTANGVNIMNTTANNTVNVTEAFRNDTRRQRALAIFVERLATREATGNTAFRRSITDTLQEEFKMTLASAAATYNVVKKFAVDNNLTEDFGRTPAAPKEPKAAKTQPATVNVARAKDGEIVATNVTIAEAEALIARNVKQKKAKLVIA